MKGFILINEGRTDAKLINIRYISSIKPLSKGCSYIQYCCPMNDEMESMPISGYIIEQVKANIDFEELVLKIKQSENLL